MIGVMRGNGLAAGQGIGDALGGQQRAFDLDVMHLGDAGLSDRGAHRRRRRLHLRHAAHLLRPKFPGKTGPHGQAPTGSGRPLADRKHQKMRRKPALSAAGHHHGHIRPPATPRQHVLQRLHRIGAGEIIHAAIALGLAKDGHNLTRRQAGIEKRLYAGDVARVAHGNTVEDGLSHPPVMSELRAAANHQLEPAGMAALTPRHCPQRPPPLQK